MTDKLKPCPFCGSEVSQQINDAWYADYIRCKECGAEMKVNTGESVDVYWNTRPLEDALQKRIAELEEELKYTDGLLKEATETIGSVVACCTYNSNNDAKIGIYGIDQKAFTRIDQFITHYNDAVSAGKVSLDVKPVKRENDYQNDNRTNTGGSNCL